MLQRIFILLVLCQLSYVSCDKKKKIDVQKTKIYGPGLYPHKLVLPVRYIFIQPYDTNGKR